MSKQKPTQADLDLLARFAGGIDTGYGLAVGWVFGKERLMMAREDWNPYKYWDQMKLVLEALVRKLQERRGYEEHDAWYWLLTSLRKKIKTGKSFDFASAINDIALEVIAKEKL